MNTDLLMRRCELATKRRPDFICGIGKADAAAERRFGYYARSQTFLLVNGMVQWRAPPFESLRVDGRLLAGCHAKGRWSVEESSAINA